MKKQLHKQLIIAIFLFASSPLTWSMDTLLSGQNITIRQSLVSSSNKFTLGFFHPDSSPDLFIGIWFSVSPKTVVWVANRDSPLNNSFGILTIHKNGSLVLYDSSKRLVWSSGTNSTSITNDISTILQLNDLGNLVLKDQTSNTIIWQSFDHPMDSLIPGMKLGKNLTTGFETVLSSWRSSSNPSKGNYTVKMDTEGAPEIILWDRDQIRARTGMWNGRYFSGLAPVTTYKDMVLFIFFVWDEDEVSYEFEDKSTQILSRLFVNEAGIIQRLIWDPDQQSWNEVWSGPKDECDYYGKCGAFSICQPNSITVCSCLRGFEIARPTKWNASDYSGGCKRRTPVGCSGNSDGFYPLNGVKLPYSHNATVDATISVEECKRRCLINCSCLAYSPLDTRAKGSGCVMWDTALMDIKYVIAEVDILYVKVSISELVTSNNRKLAIIFGTITSIVISVLLICLFGYLFERKKMISAKQDKTNKSLAQNDLYEGTDLPVFDMEMILQATDNFSITNEVGQGGFGIVYKGKLPCGQEIAVKRLSMNSSQGLNEFMNEVMLIAKLQHRNLVKLHGYCIENNERILIYEFMTNKSLDFFIFITYQSYPVEVVYNSWELATDPEKHASLNWRTRLDIITGIARGLLYLHHDSRFNIIHRDLKAANVLLDEEMNPKISDFGTARLFEREQAVLNTETVIGTRGYMSPEYIAEGTFSVKSDVYSFGVILLEIIFGKRNQGNQNLLAYVWKFWEEENILKLLDEVVECSVLTTELSRCMHVGILCVQECPDDRPSMSSVVMMLSCDNLELPAPKKPLFCRSIGSEFDTDSNLLSVDQLSITIVQGR